MDEMQAIIQIQAHIDEFLVGDGRGGNEGGGDGGKLLAARLDAGARGEPDPRLVEQTIRLLRMRQRFLRVRLGGNFVFVRVPCKYDSHWYSRFVHITFLFGVRSKTLTSVCMCVKRRC